MVFGPKIKESCRGQACIKVSLNGGLVERPFCEAGKL